MWFVLFLAILGGGVAADQLGGWEAVCQSVDGQYNPKTGECDKEW